MEKLILITGGAGFIGSNIVERFNREGIDQLLVVDNLSLGKKFFNLANKRIADYVDKVDFIEQLQQGHYSQRISAVIHMGACSSTTEQDGRYMMRNNYDYSKQLHTFAAEENIPFLYASSAAVYGGSDTFVESVEHESPLNVYGYSKLLFDNYVRRTPSQNQVAGFRFFNVYGPGERHKGNMASVSLHNYRQLQSGETAKLFGAYAGYKPGEQMRDFVYVKDVDKVIYWFYCRPEVNGIFNLGSGKAQSFNDVINAVIETLGRGTIEYIDFPEHLMGAYQSFTEADISHLRKVGYTGNFHSVQDGVADYITHLMNQAG